MLICTKLGRETCLFCWFFWGGRAIDRDSREFENKKGPASKIKFWFYGIFWVGKQKTGEVLWILGLGVVKGGPPRKEKKYGARTLIMPLLATQ